MRAITSSPAYRSGSTVIFVTWNQAVPAKALGQACTAPALPAACHVPLLVISPYVRTGMNVPTRFSHYSLLKATEKLLGARSLLGHAGDARAGEPGRGVRPVSRRWAGGCSGRPACWPRAVRAEAPAGSTGSSSAPLPPVPPPFHPPRPPPVPPSRG